MRIHCRTIHAALFLSIGLSTCAVTATACDTPVYRYAMYRWEPTPYEVYHFHDGAVDKSFTAANEKLADARNDKLAPANVAVYPVDLAKDKELKTVPRDVRRIWEAKVAAGVKAPTTLIVNPAGHEVFAGEMQASEIAGFVHSPTRKEIGKLLAKGHCGVYVLLLGKDEKLNNQAAEAIDKLIADVNSGDLSLYTGPDAYNPLDPSRKPAEQSEANGEEPASKQPDEKAAKKDASPPHSAAALKFTQAALLKSDPWFYRSLMAVENDLREFEDEPMLFVVYGRGRALPPYIGKGIVYDNLVEITDFITSACSCTVKDQNPGVDLLMSYDWESASAAVAERFGSEEGNNESLTDLFPQLIFPGGAAEKPKGESNKPKE